MAGTAACRLPARSEGLEHVAGDERPSEGVEAWVARRAVGGRVEAAEGARDFVVAAAPAVTQAEERRVDADRRAVMRHVAGDPAENIGVARKGVGDLSQMEREALAAQEGHARRIAVLPGEIDPEEPHAVRDSDAAREHGHGRAADPHAGDGAVMHLELHEQPGRAAHAVALLGREGGERVRRRAGPPLRGARSPIEEWTEPVTMSSGTAEVGSEEAAVRRRAFVHRFARDEADAAEAGVGRDLGERRHVRRERPQDVETRDRDQEVVVRRRHRMRPARGRGEPERLPNVGRAGR